MAELLQAGEPDPKTQEMAPTAREAERFLDECWSNERCLRAERGQEEEKRERDGERGGHPAWTLMCGFSAFSEEDKNHTSVPSRPCCFVGPEIPLIKP